MNTTNQFLLFISIAIVMYGSFALAELHDIATTNKTMACYELNDNKASFGECLADD